MIPLLLLSAAWAECRNTTLSQDMNCNGVDFYDELPVSLDDPYCAQEGSQDYYVDYGSQGCRFEVSDLDPDRDGLGAGVVSLPDEDGLSHMYYMLACDNCPAHANLDQVDTDCDDVGDLCDNCVFDENSSQLDQDADGLGDACDICPDEPDPGQEDSDGDGLGDACDNCPEEPNPGQEDVNENGLGDACESVHLGGGGCGSASGSWLGALLVVLILGLRKVR